MGKRFQSVSYTSLPTVKEADPRTPQTRMAATAWDIVSEKRKHSAKQSDAGLSRSTSQYSDSPLVPEQTKPGARFGGFGFGKQGEKIAAERGYKISRPVETLPSKLTFNL
jgi:hypothetical protein